MSKEVANELVDVLVKLAGEMLTHLKPDVRKVLDIGAQFKNEAGVILEILKGRQFDELSTDEKLAVTWMTASNYGQITAFNAFGATAVLKGAFGSGNIDEELFFNEAGRVIDANNAARKSILPFAEKAGLDVSDNKKGNLDFH